MEENTFIEWLYLVVCPGTTRPRFCSGHKKEGMVGLKNRPCIFPGWADLRGSCERTFTAVDNKFDVMPYCHESIMAETILIVLVLFGGILHVTSVAPSVVCCAVVDVTRGLTMACWGAVPCTALNTRRPTWYTYWRRTNLRGKWTWRGRETMRLLIHRVTESHLATLYMSGQWTHLS